MSESTNKRNHLDVFDPWSRLVEVIDSSPQEQQKAIRAIASRATDADDAHQLLAALGLDDALRSQPPRHVTQRCQDHAVAESELGAGAAPQRPADGCDAAARDTDSPKPERALRPVAAKWEWQESAACRGMDSTVFYSPHGERGTALMRRVRQAQRLCAACEVRVECAEFALAIGERHGVWGGTTHDDRVALLRRLRQR